MLNHVIVSFGLRKIDDLTGMSDPALGNTELKVVTNGHNLNGYSAGESGSLSSGLDSNGHCNGNQSNGKISTNNKNSIGNVPFQLLVGELLIQTNYGSENYIFLTNFRLFVVFAQGFYNIPVKCIEYVEMREILSLHVVCKDGKVIRISFDRTDKCSEWWGYITQNDASPSSVEDLFAFEFYSKIKHLRHSESFSSLTLDSADGEVLMFVNDNKRMEFNLKSIWRTTEMNSKFEVCETYPKLHIVPAWITDDDLQTIAKFRALRRFPSVVWRNKSNGAVIARSSQPELGWFGWRCEKDEALLSAIAQAAKLDSNENSQNMTLSVTDNSRHFPSGTDDFLLLDARSYPAAVANRAKGGGCECQDYYPNCDIQFMGLPNIHTIRKSFQSVRALCLLGGEQNNWYSALEATRWLQYISGLIRSSLVIVDAIHLKGRSTLVHCSDGWDRTAQLVSLAELLLDPYYRTIQGFRVLVEREWLNFGHKFTDRCGHLHDKDPNERCPVFFQWLDAIHQIMKQYPSAFEFNENFLMKLLQHVYACLFGTFLCNTPRERRQLKLKSRTVSVWDLLLSGRMDFQNFLYNGSCHVLYPSYHIRNLVFWESAFLQKDIFTSQSYCRTVAVSLDPSPPVQRKNVKEECVSVETCGSKTGAVDVIGDHLTKNEVVSTSSLYKDCNGGSCQSAGELEDKNKEASTQEDSDKKCTNEHEVSSFTSKCISKTLEKQLESKLNLELTDENTNNVRKQISMDDSCMTDSSRTLTSDTDADIPITSFDDSCVNGIHASPKAHRSNGFLRTHSAPDSPTMAKLPRAKSVPDIMTSSVCVNADVTKYYPPLKGHDLSGNLQKDYSVYLDIDGLPLTNSFIDEKLQEIHCTHARDLSRLQRKLDFERQQRVLAHRARSGSYSSATYSDVPDDMLSLPDSVNGERSSVSSISNDDGWEQVQIDEVQPTRWLPDHLTPNCLNCSCTFTLLYRRHHCRKCGGVFCDSCSSYKIPIPDEQLYKPVRVCIRCYESRAHGQA